MEQPRLITVAIHTLRKAQELRSTLEREGVKVTLQNVNLTAPVMSAGVRVRIFETDLPLALRIIENPEIFIPEKDSEPEGSDPASALHTVLVPVDFSERSLRAVRVAFNIAASHNAKVVLLHSFMVPHANPLMSMSVSLTFDSSDTEAEDAETSVEIAKAARAQMRQLEADLRSRIKSGDLPAVKHSSVLLEGVPEECIGQYLKEHHDVRLLVMGTRSAEKKTTDLAGSITAEVLDACRIQALTVPEGESAFTSLEGVRHVALLSTLEQEDFLALDAVNRLVPCGQPLDVEVVCMPNDKYSRATNEAARTALREYCNEHFPDYTFTLRDHDKTKPALAEAGRVDMVVVPNRKKNIFARLFNPGPAHRLLFHSDVPMMVVPV